MKLFITLLLVSLFISAQVPQKRLVQLDANTRVWMTEQQIQDLKRAVHHFADITDAPNLEKGEVPRYGPIPEKPTQQSIVRPFLQRASSESEQQLRNTITKLSNYHTRYCKNETAKEAAIWIKGQYDSIISQLPEERRRLISTRFFEHSWTQPSVIVTFKGTNREKVILGGHEDSYTFAGPSARAPGADDDASGSATVLEVFRLLAFSNYQPKKTLEFHHYACEELGLWGSQAIAQRYKQDGEQVYSMAQFDMTGYNYQNTDRFGINTDMVSTELNNFIKKLIPEYCNIGFSDRTCGQCSDHASWTRAGYRSSFPFEYRANPNIHSSSDTIDKLDFKYALQFLKLAISYAVELSAI